MVLEHPVFNRIGNDTFFHDKITAMTFSLLEPFFRDNPAWTLEKCFLRTIVFHVVALL